MAIFGVVIGSFLNVCIYRIPRGLSVAYPRRSFCPSCQTQLTWIENLPVASWIVQRGKCRSCREPISGQYPLVEVLTALGAVTTYIQFGLTPTGLVLFALCASLITISFIDLEFKIIPNVISYPGITLGLILGISSQYTGIFSPPLTQSAFDSIVGMYAGGGFFYVISLLYYWFTKEVGLGLGDVKLMGMTGAILGWHSVAPTIFLGSLFGSVIGIFCILFRGGSRKSEIPFGPWLSAGALIYAFANPPWFQM